MRSGEATKSKFRLSRDERKSSQGYVDIEKMTVEQLDELIERQKKMLQNRSFLEKLPDKGKKIISFKEELEIERRKKQDECDAACQLLYNLSLKDANVDEIEWEKDQSVTRKKQVNSHEENIEDDNGLLKIFATHSGTADGISTCSGRNSSIKSTDKDKKILYVDKFCEKYGKADKCKERFKPNQLRDNNKSRFISSAEKVKEILGSKWEVTEATPPVPVYSDTVMISLSESIKLQKEQAEILVELNKKHAMEKLLQNISIKMGNKLPANDTTQYRSNNCFYDEDSVGENDDEADDENGIVGDDIFKDEVEEEKLIGCNGSE